MTSDQITLGLVGLGKIARDQHVPALARNPRFRLVASADPHGSGIERLAAFPDLDTMLKERPDINAVSLCVPPSVRTALATTALRAGKHVLLEKPPAAGLAEAHTLSELARQQGLTLFTAWHSQFAPAVAPAREWLARRAIRSLEVIWREDVRRSHPGQQWIWQPAGYGVFDPGINAFSILVEILPGDLAVKAAQLAIPENCQTPIAAEIAMTMQGDVPVTAHFDFDYPGEFIWDIIIETDQGTVLLSKGGAELSVSGRPVDLPKARSLPEIEYDGVYRQFAKLIDARAPGVDLRASYLVADCYLIGSTKIVEPFL